MSRDLEEAIVLAAVADLLHQLLFGCGVSVECCTVESVGALSEGRSVLGLSNTYRKNRGLEARLSSSERLAL